MTEPGDLGGEAFLARLRHRDERAFNQLVLAYEEKIYRFVWRMLGHAEDAEDLTQEVFVQVFRSLDQFRGDSQLSTWIYRIAINLTKNRHKYWQRRFRKAHQDLDPSADHLSWEQAPGLTSGEISRPDLDAIGNETERIIVACLHELDAPLRELLILRDVEGLSYEEIALILESPEGTIKSRLHRARNEFKQLVQKRRGEKLP